MTNRCAVGFESAGHVETLHAALEALAFADCGQINEIADLHEFRAKNFTNRQTIKRAAFWKAEFLIVIETSGVRFFSVALFWLGCGLSFLFEEPYLNSWVAFFVLCF